MAVIGEARDKPASVAINQVGDVCATVVDFAVYQEFIGNPDDSDVAINVD